MDDRRLLVGRFGAPHGVKGEVRLQSFHRRIQAPSPATATSPTPAARGALRSNRCAASGTICSSRSVDGIADRDERRTPDQCRALSAPRGPSGARARRSSISPISSASRRWTKPARRLAASPTCSISAAATFWRSLRPAAARRCFFLSPKRSFPKSTSPAAGSSSCRRARSRARHEAEDPAAAARRDPLASKA